jgi:type II secretory pathway component PulJ
MINTKSIPAFTIIELLVALLLGSIVVGMTYMYFSRFQDYLKNTFTQENTYSELNRLQFVLQRDFDAARTIFPAGIDELIMNMEQTEITYQFEEDRILRETGEASDTFNLRVVNYLANSLKEYNDLVISVELELLPEPEKQVYLFCSKVYPAETRFSIFEEAK